MGMSALTKKVKLNISTLETRHDTYIVCVKATCC